VSRVLNGVPGVRAETAARVRAAIEQLDYRHDATASSLRRSDGKTATIGLVLENIMHPYMAALAQAVEASVSRRGVLVFSGSCVEDAKREREFIAALRSRRVDGVIVVSADSDHSYLASERKRGTALVFVDRPPRFLDADFVGSDGVEGARMAVAHLAKHGHQRIAFLGAKPTVATAAERLEGYERGLSECEIGQDPALVRMGLSTLRATEEVGAAVQELLQLPEPPTALFPSADLFTVATIDALRKLGLEHRIALVGFDDFPLANQLDPAITVVAQDPGQIGETAAELLLRRLDGDTTPSLNLRLQTTLLPRGSGEIRPHE
jgi:LacI family transcriptional regulator